MNQANRRPIFRHPLVVITTSFAFVIIGTGLINLLAMRLPATVVQEMIVLMVGASILFMVASFMIYKAGVLEHLRSLRWLLLLIVFFTVGVVLFNIWQLSRMMFFDSLYLPILAMMMGFAGLTAVGFGYYVSRAITDRLFALSDGAERVAQGDLSTRLAVRGNDEIASLMGRFNKMAQDLQAVDEEKQRLEQTRRDLVAWVSHDLRTPLTSMRVMLEALADGVITDDETRTRYVKTSLSEIQHLSHLIDDLFEMAKLDVGHFDLQFIPFPIHELVSDTIGSMHVKAERKGIHLQGEVHDSIDLVTLAPDKIQRVLKNLIDNAIKYTPTGEMVSVRVYLAEPQKIRFDVHNSGVSIPQEQLSSLFESFYRGEKSRANTDDERGAGLGLAIARGFVQAHGGEIWAESDSSHGTIFSFTLPIKQKP